MDTEKSPLQRMTFAAIVEDAQRPRQGSDSAARRCNRLLAASFYFSSYITNMLGSVTLHALGYAIADLLIDVAPVFKRTLQDRFGHASL